MSSVEKLLVQGIRSFNPKDSSVVDFYTPLTLIVGSNGAGKTTIIECLRYATTGETPPNCSNGQAFIHDTKIAGETEVKAQIKLKFKSPNGKPIVAVRSLSLIQKLHKQEYKQIDSSLQSYNSEGQKVSKSFRCSDLDKEIPELMGISKAILKHVIFCHQEESNWPLSESSKLKVKFDEIFAAVKYTKALKAIKDKRKSLTALVKEYKLKLETIESNREHYIRNKNEKVKMENQLVEVAKKLEQMKIEMIDKQNLMESAKKVEDKISSLRNEVSVLEARKVEMEKVKNQLFQSLPEVLNETDEELLFMSNTFGDELATMLKLEKELSDNLMRLNQEKEEINRKLSDNNTEFGRLQAMVDQKNEIIENRDKQISEFITRYKMQDLSQITPPYQNEDVDRFLSLVSEKLKVLTASLTKIERQSKENLSKIQSEISEHRIEHQKISERISNQNNQIVGFEKKIKDLDNEVSQHTHSPDKLLFLEKQIKQEQQLLDEMEKELEEAQLEVSIRNLNNEKIQIEKDLENCRQVLKLLNLQSSSMARLNVKKENIESKSKIINQQLTEHTPMLNKLFGKELTHDELQNSNQLLTNIKQLIQSTKVNIESQKNICSLSKEHYHRTKSEKKLLLDQLAKKEDSLKEVNKRLDSNSIIFGVDYADKDINQEIEKKEHLLHQLEKSFILLESEDILYKEYALKAQEDHRCSLCKTDINDSELDLFVNNLKSHSDDIPSKIKAIKSQMQEIQNILSKITVIKPDFLLKKELLLAIPDISVSIKQVSEGLEISESTDVQESNVLSLLQETLKSSESLLLSIQSIHNIREEIKNIGQEILQEEIQILKNTNDPRSLEEIEKEIDFQSNSLKLVNTELERISNSFSKQNSNILEKKSNLINLKNQLTNIKSSSGIIERILNTKQEMLENIENSQKFIQENELLVQEKYKIIEDLKQNLANEEGSFEKKQTILQKEKNLFSTKIESIKFDQSKLSDASSCKERLFSMDQETNQLKSKLETIQNDYNIGDQTVQDIRKDLSQHNNIKRAIQDNIAYRQQNSNIDTINKQILRKKEHISQISTQENLPNTAELVREMNSLKTKYDTMMGQTSILTNQIENYAKELKRDYYNNIDEVYRDLRLKVESTEIIGSDLDKYYKALDKSLMKYHNLKMDEINKTIKELWLSTYRGNDIDTIEIRSEEGTAANKSINYRVVMIKGNVELDMRGRCSAGQKVLACLVIRMALAENFCINCGILALDEPTSNLDRANIESFANALINIIEVRKNQKSFQLIIITHDEEFVQYLSRGNFTDYYWRVTKNDKQHSHIERKEISDL
ncbi:hypothetical protein CYY_007407 [Polysphondylium violaceum]|uniref:DNA repair protein RAD50 n=1 Tax=Polysphondylium violaceum TaxID=133409 RepID=A0A8J4PR04_9MYCE|nr:hypothetical protein CYY_007407 [Polysphondylium violaceum]